MNRINYPCKSIWRLIVPDGAVGASEDHFDLWNGTGATAVAAGHPGTKIIVDSIKVIAAGDVAITGAVGVNLHLHRTSAIGTAGTAATQNGTANTATTFNTVTPGGDTLTADISARLKPTGGATLGSWLSQTSILTEELGAGTYIDKWLIDPLRDEPVVVLPGTGIKVIQGTVAGLGSIGFIVSFGIMGG